MNYAASIRVLWVFRRRHTNSGKFIGHSCVIVCAFCIRYRAHAAMRWRWYRHELSRECAIFVGQMFDRSLNCRTHTNTNTRISPRVIYENALLLAINEFGLINGSTVCLLHTRLCVVIVGLTKEPMKFGFVGRQTHTHMYNLYIHDSSTEYNVSQRVADAAQNNSMAEVWHRMHFAGWIIIIII